MNEASQECIKEFLKDKDVDMLLLNECYFNEKHVFKYANYKSIFTANKEVGIIYKKELQVDKISNSFNDDYNLVCRVNTQKGSFIIYITYNPPNDGHVDKRKKIIDNLREINKKYSDLKLILFGDLNCDREKFKKNYISPLKLEEFKGIFKEEEEEYTRSIFFLT